MQDAVKYVIYHDRQPLRIFESRKCQNRKYFNPKAICQKGFYKCSSDPGRVHSNKIPVLFISILLLLVKAIPIEPLPVGALLVGKSLSRRSDMCSDFLFILACVSIIEINFGLAEK